MVCALPECDAKIPESKRGRFCSTLHAKRAQSRRSAALARGDILEPGEIPVLKDRTQTETALTRDGAVNRLAALLEDNGIAVEDIGKVKAVRLNQWTALAKGEMVEDPDTGRKYREPTRRVDMESVGVVLHPSWDEGPAWPVVQPADPVEVMVPFHDRQQGQWVGWKTAILLPDPQFGFRRNLWDGTELQPFHDERALNVALQIAEWLRPDLTIWLGDVLDLASASVKHPQEAGFALTVQPAVNAAHSWLAAFAALTNETRYIEGNHDLRLATLIQQNALAAYGIKRANAPEEWPVMSVPNLLRFEELGIEYVGGYPAGATYLNDNLAAIHGTRIGNTTKSSASMVVDDERVSVITGHVHRIETRFKTRNTRAKEKITFAHTPGCLCHIDGRVPSVKGGVDAHGASVRHFEDWQQGIAVVTYEEGDGRFNLETVPIIDGWAMFRGELIEARDDAAA